MTTIAYAWFSGRANIGVVVYRNNHGKIKAVMTTVHGFNKEEDIQHITDWGSTIPDEMAIGAINYCGTIEDIVGWNEFKKAVKNGSNTDKLEADQESA